MIWWYIIPTVIVFSVPVFILVRMHVQREVVRLERNLNMVHGCYMRGEPFTIEGKDYMPFAKCNKCGQWFRLGPFPWHFQLAPNQPHFIDRELPDTQ